jgi:hypothetical protein
MRRVKYLFIRSRLLRVHVSIKVLAPHRPVPKWVHLNAVNFLFKQQEIDE